MFLLLVPCVVMNNVGELVVETECKMPGSSCCSLTTLVHSCESEPNKQDKVFLITQQGAVLFEAPCSSSDTATFTSDCSSEASWSVTGGNLSLERGEMIFWKSHNERWRAQRCTAPASWLTLLDTLRRLVSRGHPHHRREPLQLLWIALSCSVYVEPCDRMIGRFLCDAFNPW